jgi:signal transduction histidine kinase
MPKTNAKRGLLGEIIRGHKLPALIALCFVVIVITVSVQGYKLVHKELVESALSKRSSIAYLSSELLTERFDRLIDVAISLSTRVRFRTLVQAGAWDDAGIILAEVPDAFSYIDRVFVAKPDGTLMVDIPELSGGVRGRNFQNRDWYQGVSREWRPYISDVYQRAAEPQIHVFAVAVPIEGIDGRVAGILVLQVSLGTFFEWTRHVDAGSEGNLYVVDRNGTLAFHPGYESHVQLVDFSGSPVVRRLQQGRRGVETLGGINPREDMVVAYGPMPNHGWGLVVMEPEQAVFSAKNALFRRILISDVLLILLVFSALWMAYRIKGQRIQAEQDREAKARLENEVARRTQALEEANRELESFSYSVSHDLRAPLRAINGFSEALEEDCAERLDEHGKHKLFRIRENAHRMGMLIDDILRFSRLGRTAVIPGKVDMNTLVREIIADIQNTTDTDSVHFTVHSLPEAWCDRALMHQVWENLLSNAVKFTGHRQERRVEIGAFEEAGEIVYYVKDNGSGFDMEYYDKLFGVFQRLHGMEEFPGTGVGLAIVRRVVTSHGGRIWAQSAVDQGASFFFTLGAAPGH